MPDGKEMMMGSLVVFSVFGRQTCGPPDHETMDTVKANSGHRDPGSSPRQKSDPHCVVGRNSKKQLNLYYVRVVNQDRGTDRQTDRRRMYVNGS